MEKQNKLNLSVLAKQYSDEESAWVYLERVRWGDKPLCPHCGNIGADFIVPENGERKTKRGNVTYRRIWRCHNCKNHFSVLVGTIFEDSHIPLSKWLLAVHLLNASKNSISSCELARLLGITQKSAWHMGHRIRFGMTHSPLEQKLNGTVEVDETYIGGKEKNKHANRRLNQGRGTVGKTPVLSVLERGGDVRSVQVENVNDKTARAELRKQVDSSAMLMTDTSPVYNEIGKEFASHQTVDHSASEYARGDVHINSLEGYYGILKPSLVGTHRHVSKKHLHRYLAGFDWLRNTRKTTDGERATRTIQQVRGKRLMYRDLIGKAK